MKKSLIFLSSLTTLSSLINSVVKTNNTVINDQINNLSKNIMDVNENSSIVFNNKYSYLSDDDWITNQSSSNKNYYSYNTSALVNYNFTNARQTFLVDTSGNLIYNKKITIPEKDKTDIENTRQEMISGRKVSTVKDAYSPYSKSEYSNSYFSGGNQDWQYLQLGGFEKQIDISKQSGADKVEHNNCLSETLGLYYIAKAARNGQITKTIADNLGQYFVSQSSLKGKLTNDLVNKIINLIMSNTEVYNFLYNAPMIDSQTNLYKNYATNYISDKTNNVVAIYYSIWNNDNLVENLNVNTYKSYSGNDDYGMWHYGDNKIICNFTQSGTIHSWEDFTTLYPTLSFDDTSFFSVYSQYGEDKMVGSHLKIDTSKIDTSYNFNHNFWSVSITHDGGFFGAKVIIKADAQFWHDDHNVYVCYRWYDYSKWATEGINFSTILKQSSFNNCMK